MNKKLTTVLVIVILILGYAVLAWLLNLWPINHVSLDWETYRNEEYGFELKTPDQLNPLSPDVGNGWVEVSGKTYQTLQLNDSIYPAIRIIKDYNNVSVNPYADKSDAYSQRTISGTRWHVFYQPNGGMPRCDSATLQTLTSDGKNTIQISMLDEAHCPGDTKQMSSVVFLEKVLSTFKFIK